MSQFSNIEEVAKLFEERGFVRVPTKEASKQYKMPSFEKVARFTYPADVSITAAVYAYSVIVYQTRSGRLHSLFFKPTFPLEPIREGLNRLIQEGVLKPAKVEAPQSEVL